jgi:hypothetical protein
MALKEIIALIDAEIATLKQARSLLAAISVVGAASRKAGRPAKVLPDTPKVPTRKKKRYFSPETRARLAESARKRWAVLQIEALNRANRGRLS